MSASVRMVNLVVLTAVLQADASVVARPADPPGFFTQGLGVRMSTAAFRLCHAPYGDRPRGGHPGKDQTALAGGLSSHVMSPAISVPNRVQRRDAEVLIGILAVRDDVIWGGSLDEWTTSKVAERFVRQGLLAADHNRHDVQARNDLNQRLRYAAGEYESPPPSTA